MKAELTDVDRAHTAYTKRSLAFYDWWVLGISNHRIWKCETEKILDLYREKLTANHLEVGVGTGYFLDHSLPGGYPRITLLDINRNCLERSAARIAAYKPEVHQDKVLKPLQLKGKLFDSMAINYLLHCLPGALEAKAGKVFDHLVPFLQNDGVLFGSTILGMDIQRPLPARLLMHHYNRRGIFSNTRDSLGGIMETLSERFKTFNVEVCGCVVLFWGEGLRKGYRHAESAD